MKRFDLLVGIFLFLIPVLTACSQATPVANEPYEKVTLKMNYALVTSYAPIIIAEVEGYFADYGIEIEKLTFNSSAEAIPLVLSGEIDVFAGAANAGILNVLGKEENIKVVADRGHISPDGCTFQAIVVRKDLFESGEITEGKDLAGHTISTPPTGPGIYFLSRYLEQEGMSLEDVELTDIPTASYIDALHNKAVDAIVTTELHLSRLMAAGDAVILARSEDVVGDFQTSLLAFGKNLLKDNPDLGVRFMAAYLKGVEQYNEGKTERNLQVLAEATGESIEVLQSSCWIPINNDGSIDFSAVDRYQQWAYQYGQLDAVITEEQFWDPGFLTKAKNLLKP
jgi:NitT/TauT family transport system substrate-binding protein